MNKDRIQGQRKPLADALKEKWGKLAHDDLDVAEGNSAYLAGRLQERHGIAKEEVERQVKAFDREL